MLRQLDLKDEMILRWFLNHGEVGKELLCKIPRPTLYRRIKRLIRSGLLRETGNGGYEVTEEGEKALLKCQQSTGGNVREGDQATDFQKMLAYLEIETGESGVDALRMIVDFWRNLKSCGWSLERMRRVVGGLESSGTDLDLLEEIADLAVVLKKLGFLECRRINSLVNLAKVVEEHEIGVGTLQQAVGMLLLLKQRKTPFVFLSELIELAERLWQAGVDPSEHMEDLVQAAIDITVITREIEKLQDERDKLLEKRGKLQEDLRGLQMLHEEAWGKWLKMVEEVRMLREERKALLVELDSLQHWLAVPPS